MDYVNVHYDAIDTFLTIHNFLKMVFSYIIYMYIINDVIMSRNVNILIFFISKYTCKFQIIQLQFKTYKKMKIISWSQVKLLHFVMVSYFMKHSVPLEFSVVLVSQLVVSHHQMWDLNQ